jgi:hypothetical protein
VTVAPLSLDVEYRADCDLVVPEPESPLGCPFMIEAWNEATILEHQLERYLGDLPQPYKRYLGLLAQAQLGADVDLSSLRGSVGPAIAGESDPRVAFQEDEHERCEALRRPLMRLVGELEQRTAEAPAETVLRLARHHLPSAFPREEEVLPELTVGDVAAKIQAEQAAGRPLPAADEMTNRQLLGNPTPLPEEVTAGTVRRIVEKLAVQASEEYRDLFRNVALALDMAREQRNIELAAARDQSRRRRPRKIEQGGPTSE